MPGVQLVHPRERLEDVVLTQEQRRVAESLLGAWPWLGKTGHALGILLHGPSGTGKTMLARGLAGTAGLPLLIVDGKMVSTHDHEREVVTGLLRRAAIERAILFIDEADDVVPNGSDASRALLMELERIPAVVILATNSPYGFDPALDRRLLVKLGLPMPGPHERAHILLRELRVQGHDLSEGLLECPEVLRLAEGVRLSGGYWRNIVEMAGIMADQRCGGQGPITLDDLTCALRQQAGEDASPLVTNAQHVRWVDVDATRKLALPGGVLADEVHSAIEAIGSLRAERAEEGLLGIGACLVIHGPERHLGDAVIARLAGGLRLPFGWISLRTRPAVGPQEDDQEDDDDIFGEGPSKGLWVAAMGGRGSGRKRSAYGMALARMESDVLGELEEELGELAVVGLRLNDGACVEHWLPLIDHLAASRHLLVVHQLGGALPPELTRRAAFIRPWAKVDPALRRAAWGELGGRGDVPIVGGLGELAAAVARQRLHRAGLIGGQALVDLP
jgi:hypothetical protein